jgi:hypothetical protein
MATNDDYLRLRRMTGEVDSKTYTDTDMREFLTLAGDDMNLAASAIWREKASAYADLVNMAEAGSSRSNSDLFKHAKEQEVSFLAASSSGVVDSGGGWSTTRPIVRP